MLCSRIISLRRQLGFGLLSWINVAITLSCAAETLKIEAVIPTPTGGLRLEFPAGAASYYRILQGSSPDAITNAVVIGLAAPLEISRGSDHAFYRVQAVSRSTPFDSDRDGKSDLYELRSSQTDPLHYDEFETATGAYLGLMSGQVTVTPVSRTSQIRIRVTQMTRRARVHFSSLKNVAGKEQPLGNNLVIRAAIIPADSTGFGPDYPRRRLLTFSGSPTGTLLPTELLSSDPLPDELSPGYYWLRTYYSNQGSGEYVRNRVPAPIEWGYFEGVVDEDQVSSELDIRGRSAVGLIFAPFALTGVVQPGAKRGVLVVGDSNMGDYFDGGSVGETSRGGWGARALGDEHGLVNISQGAETAESFAPFEGRARRWQATRWCGSAIILYGTNDARKPPADTQARLQAINEALREAGIATLFSVSIPPHTLSSDGWMSVDDQRADDWPVIKVLNEWLASGGGGANHFIDLANRVGDNAGRWLIGERSVTGVTEFGSNPMEIRASGMGIQTYVGKTIRFTSGIHSGRSAVIMWNLPTSLGLFTALPGAPEMGDAFEILDNFTADGVHMSTKALLRAASAVDPALFP